LHIERRSKSAPRHAQPLRQERRRERDEDDDEKEEAVAVLDGWVDAADVREDAMMADPKHKNRGETDDEREEVWPHGHEASRQGSLRGKQVQDEQRHGGGEDAVTESLRPAGVAFLGSRAWRRRIAVRPQCSHTKVTRTQGWFLASYIKANEVAPRVTRPAGPDDEPQGMPRV
jgi:hypothetical protein